jgi:hypothetical protein
MQEVIALENEIRALLPAARKTRATDLVADAEAIIAGKPTTQQGTRLSRLQQIAAELRAVTK